MLKFSVTWTYLLQTLRNQVESPWPKSNNTSHSKNYVQGTRALRGTRFLPHSASPLSVPLQSGTGLYNAKVFGIFPSPAKFYQVQSCSCPAHGSNRHLDLIKVMFVLKIYAKSCRDPTQVLQLGRKVWKVQPSKTSFCHSQGLIIGQGFQQTINCHN